MGVRDDLLAIKGMKNSVPAAVPPAAIAAALHGDTDLRTAINRLIGFIDEGKHGITRARSAKAGLLAKLKELTVADSRKRALAAQAESTQKKRNYERKRHEEGRGGQAIAVTKKEGGGS